MGLWNSYGERGVAVVSSVGRIRKAFSKQIARIIGTSVGRVKYVGRRANDFDGTDKIQTGFTGPFTSNINAIATKRKQDLCLIYTP
jgi:hypothetical protein